MDCSCGETNFDSIWMCCNWQLHCHTVCGSPTGEELFYLVWCSVGTLHPLLCPTCSGCGIALGVESTVSSPLLVRMDHEVEQFWWSPAYELFDPRHSSVWPATSSSVSLHFSCRGIALVEKQFWQWVACQLQCHTTLCDWSHARVVWSLTSAELARFFTYCVIASSLVVGLLMWWKSLAGWNHLEEQWASKGQVPSVQHGRPLLSSKREPVKLFR